MPAANAPRLAAAYFLVQAVLVPLWWAMLLVVPVARDWFLPARGLDPAFVAFVAPDLAVLSVGSAIAGVLARGNHRMARPAAWFVFGAVLYATVYTLAWTVLVHSPFLSAALMIAASAGSAFGARALRA